jgi:predicted MFS family arabinose efflux permease
VSLRLALFILVVAEQMAGDLGFSTKLIGLVLSASSFFGFLGAVATTLVLEKVGRFQLIRFSYSALALALLILPRSWRFVLSDQRATLFAMLLRRMFVLDYHCATKRLA